MTKTPQQKNNLRGQCLGSYTFRRFFCIDSRPRCWHWRDPSWRRTVQRQRRQNFSASPRRPKREPGGIAKRQSQLGQQQFVESLQTCSAIANTLHQGSFRYCRSLALHYTLVFVWIFCHAKRVSHQQPEIIIKSDFFHQIVVRIIWRLIGVSRIF